jgi:hypothetical protein
LKSRDPTRSAPAPKAASWLTKARIRLPRLDPAEWVPFNAAFAHIRAASGSRDVAEHDLRQDLRSGRLIAAWRFLKFSTGAEVCERLKPLFWRHVRISVWVLPDRDAIRVHVVLSPGTKGVFFISRASLYKHYPDIGANGAARIATPKASPSEPPRKRGPLVVHDWHAIDGQIARYCLNKEGRVAVPENESLIVDAALAWCDVEFGRQPAASEMREAVKRICAALRKGPEPLPKKRLRQRSR